MTLRLHWSPDSANLVVRVALELFGLPFEGVRVNRGKGEHKTADYLGKNPQGLIPVLEDGSLILFETGAILWHIAETVGELGPDGPPMTDAVARATALKWVFYLSNTVHADLRLAFYPDRYVEDVAALRAGVARRMRTHCDLLEAQLDPGAAITIVEIYLGICLRWARVFPRGNPVLDSLDPWPGLRELGERLEGDPAVRRAFAAEFIPGDRPITAPRPPDLPEAEVTGV